MLHEAFCKLRSNIRVKDAGFSRQLDVYQDFLLAVAVTPDRHYVHRKVASSDFREEGIIHCLRAGCHPAGTHPNVNHGTLKQIP
ncbi:MAG: hypothetical protein BWY06_03125 [Candidatus Latescibacteria bacterium ADurb.Bin168]|nr:MAG: hypothetical protein BWY06_03125 [Candidatus Latescibacteria bacterium ADurb.Bin168]